MDNLRGLATGIGSLPFKDPEAALDLIFKYVPSIPFWPQLPKRDIREGMVAQFSEGLPYLKVSAEGGLSFSATLSREKDLEIFYERVIANDVDYFKVSENFAAGLPAFYNRLEEADLKSVEFIKCQVTGPFTFAASIKDEGGVSVLHDPVFMQVILKGLGMKALWQIKLFKKFGKKIIIFIDEPYLGCFGSAYTPLDRAKVLEALREFTKSIKAQDVLIGVHCCGNTDWSIFTDVPDIDIINFDAFDYQEKFVLYAPNLKAFIEKGGIICWGIVPTTSYTGSEQPEGLSLKLQEGIDVLIRKGLDKALLQNQLLISPACGLGSLEQGKSEGIFKLLSETSKLIRK